VPNLVQVGHSYHVDNTFKDLYGNDRKVIPYNFTDFSSLSITPDTYIIFGGGEDIHPSLYGQVNKFSHVQSQPSARDKLEREIFKIGVENGAKFIGICRGAQMITALAGGQLWQDVNNHNGSHDLIWDYDNPLLSGINMVPYTTSVHHQMCRVDTIPFKTDLLAWSDEASRYRDDKMTVDDYSEEPEIFYIKDLKALCIQGHPEFVAYDDPYAVTCRQLAAKLLGE